MRTVTIICSHCGHENARDLPKNARHNKNYLNTDLEAVKVWETRMSERGNKIIDYMPASDLYQVYKAMCPDLPAMTQRRFSSSLLALGWDYKRRSTGRIYGRPKPFGTPIPA